MGGGGWSRCLGNLILGHVAKDMAYSLFVAVGIYDLLGAFLGPFLDISSSWSAAKSTLTQEIQAAREVY